MKNGHSISNGSTATNGLITPRRGRPPRKTPPPTITLGSISLATWLTSNGGTSVLGKLAEDVGCTVGTVRQWANGHYRPGTISRNSLERITRIERDQWDRVVPTSRVVEGVVAPAAATVPPPVVGADRLDMIVAILIDIRTAVQATETYWCPDAPKAVTTTVASNDLASSTPTSGSEPSAAR